MSQQLNVQNLVVDLQTEVGMARAVDALNHTKRDLYVVAG